MFIKKVFFYRIPNTLSSQEDSSNIISKNHFNAHNILNGTSPTGAGNNIITTNELERFKQELIVEFQRELAKTKQEIIAAFRQECQQQNR